MTLIRVSFVDNREIIKPARELHYDICAQNYERLRITDKMRSVSRENVWVVHGCGKLTVKMMGVWGVAGGWFQPLYINCH